MRLGHYTWLQASYIEHWTLGEWSSLCSVQYCAIAGWSNCVCVWEVGFGSSCLNLCLCGFLAWAWLICFFPWAVMILGLSVVGVLCVYVCVCVWERGRAWAYECPVCITHFCHGCWRLLLWIIYGRAVIRLCLRVRLSHTHTHTLSQLHVLDVSSPSL